MISQATNRSSNDDAKGAVKAESIEDWTDEDLFARFLRHRDEIAYAVLFERHRNLLCDYARGVIKDHSLAKDVAQEVLIVLWEDWEKFDAARNPRSLLMKMAYHQAVDLARREQRMEAKGLWVGAENGFMDSESWLSDEKSQFWLILKDLLTPMQFRMIELRYLHGLKVSECAESQGVKTGTVKKHLHEAMKRMKKENIFSTFLTSYSDYR